MNKLLWEPSQERIESSNMYRFMNLINEKHKKDLKKYEDLYKWSINNIPKFWEEMWNFADIKFSKSYKQVLDDVNKMPGNKWFSGARLNFAENLLTHRDDHPAIIFRGEDKVNIKLTYTELYRSVAQIAKSMKDHGVKPGDRVVGFVPNMPQSIIAMLATTSIGAIWSSCSPDFGIKGVLDRFGQIQPKILFAADGYFFKGKKIDSMGRITKIIKQIPSIKVAVIIPYTNTNFDTSQISNAISYEDFKALEVKGDIDFEQLPFSHPLYIMYSSGTTGLPKCIVQSAGGILIHHLKELILHTDLKRNDKIFYFTTCGWMMWNWLVSSLAVGATLILYDGNPFYPSPDAMWEMAEEEGITVFGTSAGYISALESSGIKPLKTHNLKSLRTILSTGSPLSIENFEFVYNSIKPDLQLASISGGTDLNGCFALGNPMSPVYAGELQCRGLAMKVESFDANGQAVTDVEGELVCTAPFPSMPIYFWDDPENKKYHSAYFNVYLNVWCHGDYILITEQGGVVMLGRSDATLNPGGVRIGTAEIYRQVEQLEEIEDSIVVGQSWQDDTRVILFVKVVEGKSLDNSLVQKIKATIRSNASPRHVPAKIVEVPDIPYTLNMKKVELAVKNVIHGRRVTNKDALKNPEILKSYEGIKQLEEE